MEGQRALVHSICSRRRQVHISSSSDSQPTNPLILHSCYREYIMEFMAVWFTKLYNWVIVVPKWMLLFASGSVASLVIGLLHGKPKNEAPVPAVPKPTVRTAAAASAQASSSSRSSTTPKVAVGTARASAPPAAANTDSEHESSAPAKRTSTRQRKAKK